MALGAIVNIAKAAAPFAGKALTALKGVGVGNILNGLSIAAPLGMMGFSMVQNHSQAKKTEEMSKDMKSQMDASNNAIASQFARSTGLSFNTNAALGGQQAVPGGQFPPGMG